MLASQFVSGLRPEIKAKIAGTEGSIDALLTKARFEEAKIRDLASNQQQRQKCFRSGFSGPSQHNKAAKPSEHQKAGTTEKSTVRCYGCGAYGHYRNKCPVRDRGGPAESSGQRSTKVRVGNVAPEKSESWPPADNDIGDSLKKVMATMHSISSKEGDVELGPVPSALVEFEGEQVKALLDTGSSVTCVSFVFLLKVWWAKKHTSELSPEEWRKQVEKKLQPTPVGLRNYGGGRLPVVRQTRVTMSRSGYYVEAVVQVQKDAPAQLIIGTDLLSKLGFIFLCSEPENENKDLLESSDSGGSGSSEEAMCLLQAVRLPGRHAKFVRATAPNGYSLACFDPSEELYKQRLFLPEAVVEPDVEGCVMMVMENHGCEPVVLEEGYVLGELQDVKCNEASDGEGRQGVVSAVIMGDDFGEERLQRLKEKVKFDPSNLADGEVDQLNDLLVEYADVFALDSSELGMTDLVTHAIDTGDSVPI